MSDYEVNVDVGDVSYDFGALASPLSDLGGGGGGDVEYEYVEVEVDEDGDDDDTTQHVQVQERIVQADGSVVIKIKASDSDDGDHHKKKVMKKVKKLHAGKPPTMVAAAAVKLTAIAVDAMTAPVGEHVHGDIQTGQWSTGLFNCFQFCVPNCCMATFCPCISVAQIATRIGFKYSSVLIAFAIAVGLEYLAYCLMFATIRHKEEYTYYDYSSTWGYVTYDYYVTSNRLSFWGYIAYVISILIFIAFWQLRTKVREAFQLPGSCIEDCCVSFFCSCCSVAQMATHVKSYKPGSCDFGPPDELPAYAN